MKHVVIVGGGNAALCAGIAALDAGAKVTLFEKASAEEAGGNSRYTAGAMRFCYNGRDDILALLGDPDDERIARTEFGGYEPARFESDMLQFNAGQPLSSLQQRLIDDSYETMRWLSGHNVRFDPIYSRQAFEKDGRFVFWGGLTLEARGEGVGLVDAEIEALQERIAAKLGYELRGHRLELYGVPLKKSS